MSTIENAEELYLSKVLRMKKEQKTARHFLNHQFHRTWIFTSGLKHFVLQVQHGFFLWNFYPDMAVLTLVKQQQNPVQFQAMARVRQPQKFGWMKDDNRLREVLRK